MIYPNPYSVKNGEGELCFAKKASLFIPENCYNLKRAKLFGELYSNFTAGIGKLSVKPCDLNGNRAYFCPEGGFFEKLDSSRLKNENPALELESGTAYAIKINGVKAAISFENEKALNYALFTLLQLIEVRCSKFGQEVFTLPQCEIQDKPALNGMRAVHICVFPESPYAKIRRAVRLAAFLKYTHVIIEFWGTYRYKCFKDFGRKGLTYSRRQIKAIVNDAQAMGLELIPMLNVYGHASENRAIYGKHTALDQNLKHADLFDTSGWTWNLTNDDVLTLQKQMISELCELFGSGKYFHIGCDEAYTYGDDRAYVGKNKRKIFVDHVNAIAEHLKSLGRRTIMWGDTFLSREIIPEGDGLELSSKDEGAASVEEQLAALNKNIILADWQYYTSNENLPTAAFLASKGFSVTVSPFDNIGPMKINYASAIKNGYFGVIQTTWNTLFSEMLTLPHGACFGWEGDRYVVESGHRMRCYIAALYRKLYRTKKYEDDGLRRHEIQD